QSRTAVRRQRLGRSVFRTRAVPLVEGYYLQTEEIQERTNPNCPFLRTFFAAARDRMRRRARRRRESRRFARSRQDAPDSRRLGAKVGTPSFVGAAGEGTVPRITSVQAPSAVG